MPTGTPIPSVGRNVEPHHVSEVGRPVRKGRLDPGYIEFDPTSTEGRSD